MFSFLLVRLPSPASPVRSALTFTSVARCSLSPSRTAALAQVARLSMAAFQLGSLISPELVKPLYTPAVYASLSPSLLSLLRTVGLANISLTIALRKTPPPTHLLNALSLSVTPIIYLLFPVKPLYITAPFCATLLVLATLNAATNPTQFNMSTSFRPPFYIKALIPCVTLFCAITNFTPHLPIATVYYLQLSLLHALTIAAPPAPLAHFILQFCTAALLLQHVPLLAALFLLTATSTLLLPRLGIT